MCSASTFRYQSRREALRLFGVREEADLDQDGGRAGQEQHVEGPVLHAEVRDRAEGAAHAADQLAVHRAAPARPSCSPTSEMRRPATRALQRIERRGAARRSRAPPRAACGARGSYPGSRSRCRSRRCAAPRSTWIETKTSPPAPSASAVRSSRLTRAVALAASAPRGSRAPASRRSSVARDARASRPSRAGRRAPIAPGSSPPWPGVDHHRQHRRADSGAEPRGAAGAGRRRGRRARRRARRRPAAPAAGRPRVPYTSISTRCGFGEHADLVAVVALRGRSPRARCRW